MFSLIFWLKSVGFCGLDMHCLLLQACQQSPNARVLGEILYEVCLKIEYPQFQWFCLIFPIKRTNFVYTIWFFNIAMENPILWAMASIAMLNNQRVQIFQTKPYENNLTNLSPHVRWMCPTSKRPVACLIRLGKKFISLGTISGFHIWDVYFYTWWLIPLSKWVITPVINGISRVNPLLIGVNYATY